ncbi:MAG: phosphoribosylformylglycinamidine cyclo-ligase [Candidatus Altiarchaeales archaeon]|nr:phosphoribosylformylglycinamidine cyclo-ligase [Candidatus Altiarchaeales archaeon]MBD3417204.1 phosphoribosylformylglycinamidine cyclo-ligase [Candidatus Altiarchaeales archaeon]
MKKGEKRPDTYAKAGVDIRKEDRTIKGIKKWVSRTFSFREGKKGAVLEDIGSFANLMDFGDFALAFCMDGVGSKVLIAQELEKYDTIGIDCIAMNVNDLICVGAEPVSMVDYLAMEETDDEIAKEISAGLYEGAKQSGISIVGGETASLPEIIKGVDGRGFDLAAAVIGIVNKDKVITGEKIMVGDVVLGFKSSGIHSNGMTLARKVTPKNMWMNLLTPTRIYVKEVMEILGKYDVHGLVNITGGGFLNLLRITEHGFHLDNMPDPQMIFKKIQELGKVSDEEMYRTFNMGIGFCAIAPDGEADRIVEEYGQKHGIARIGTVVEGHDVTVIRKGVEIKLERTIY